MIKQHNQSKRILAMVGFLLVAIACTCGPLSQVTDASATLQSAQGTIGAVATQGATFEAMATQTLGALTVQAPELNATMTALFGSTDGSGDTGGDTGGGTGSTRSTPEGYSGPVYDGGDGYETILIKPIALGETQTARLESGFEAHNWLFEGTSGQSITIRVAGISGTDPRVTVLDPNGEEIGYDDDSGGGPDGRDAVLTLTLPANGTYTLRIDVFTTGDYTITVE